MTLQGTTLTQSGKIMSRSGKELVAGPSGSKDCCCSDPCCTGSHIAYYPSRTVQTYVDCQFSTNYSNWEYSGYPGDVAPDVDIDTTFYYRNDYAPSAPTCPDDFSQARLTLDLGSGMVWVFSNGAPTFGTLTDLGSDNVVTPTYGDPATDTSGPEFPSPRIWICDVRHYRELTAMPGPPSAYGEVVQEDSGFSYTQVLLTISLTADEVYYFESDHLGTMTGRATNTGEFSLVIFVDYLGRLALVVVWGSVDPSTVTGSATITPVFSGSALKDCSITFSVSFGPYSFNRDRPDMSVTGSFSLTSNQTGCPA